MRHTKPTDETNNKIMIFIVAIIAFLFFIGLVLIALKRLHRTANSFEIVIGTTYVLSLALFAIGMMIHNNPYYKAIDPIDGECYSPFAERHIITLIFYFLLFNISVLLVWTKNKNLPPLTLTLSLIFIVIGIMISIAILLQISVHDTSSMDIYYESRDSENLLFVFAPLFSIIIGIILCKNVINQEISETAERTYSNKYLNSLNVFLKTRSRNPIWILILLFPTFIIVTIILILFGQDTNSIVKVFTDTTTWKLSQQIHPPILDHRGHYLCTVAASGHPKIVKPIKFGKRNGNQIIVNRQLLIANAFEEMIQDLTPKFHYKIRTFYDQYGYNLSKKINTPFLSSTTYILMKPLEWIFLICLYLICNKPEQKINRQYAE